MNIAVPIPRHRRLSPVTLLRFAALECNTRKYYLIYLTLHWPIFINNPLIFVSFTLLYSRSVPFVINKYNKCSYQLSSIPVKYRSGIGVWLRCVWFGLNPALGNIFLCPRHSKNGGGALSVTPVRPCVRPSVRPLSKYVVRSITFERLHGFNSNLVCLYIISKHRSSSIWVTIH